MCRESGNHLYQSNVPTNTNLADQALTLILTNTFMSSVWLKGPDFLFKLDKDVADVESSFSLANPNSDPEVHRLMTSCATWLVESLLDPRCFESFSSWRSLLRTTSMLIHRANTFKQDDSTSSCQSWHTCQGPHPEDLAKAKNVIIRSLQFKAFPKLNACIQVGKEIPKQSRLNKLSP